MLKLLQEIFGDAERSSIAKDETSLHQNLHLFLQQHQDVFLRNMIFNQEAMEGKKVVDASGLSSLYYQFLRSQDSMEKDLSKKPLGSELWVSSSSPHFDSFSVLPKSSRSSRPGKPTVLTLEEEAILANFILQLEEKQIRLPREDVRKLVMGMLSALGRTSHPFKDDGPHRHWFKVPIDFRGYS